MTTINGDTMKMRVFVASWFFPPNSSSEGFVTWKLLRNSAHEYDVVCSTSHKWGYSETLQVSDANIDIHPVETEDLRVWVGKAVEMFEALHAERKYDAFDARSPVDEGKNPAFYKETAGARRYLEEIQSKTENQGGIKE